MNEYYASLQNHLKDFVLEVFPVKYGIFSWKQDNDVWLLCEQVAGEEFLRAGYQTEPWKVLSDDELMKLKRPEKYIKPRSCDVNTILKALQKMEGDVDSTLLLRRTNKNQVCITCLPTWTNLQAQIQLKQWFQCIQSDTTDIYEALECALSLKHDAETDFFVKKYLLYMIQNTLYSCSLAYDC